MSFRTALTGLNAANADLGVISNNIANNNTTGFKESRAEFGDIFSLSDLGTSTRRSVGTGVKLNAVTQQFKQGNLDTTGNPLDLGLDGEGLFMLRDGDVMKYTRAGGFGIDKDGYIVNNTGQRLQGFASLGDAGFAAQTSDIFLDTKQNDAKATTKTLFGINLDAGDVSPTVTPFDYANPESYNYSTSSTFYDSQGTSHTLTVYFVKDSTGPNSWTVYYGADGKNPLGDSAATPPVAPAVTPTNNTITFDSNGQIVKTLDHDSDPTTPNVFDPLDISVDLTALDPNNGATSPLLMSLDFTGSTQFGSKSSTNSVTQDGFASGRLVGVDVGEDGTIYGRYSNGQSKAQAMVALANFRNKQGLSPVGDAAWVQTAAAGEAIVGQPGTSSLGLVRSGALELSNVELTEQLVKMISAQRNFQANAQVISTADQMTQTLLQIR
jgi:flagellar hook protein FlgE